MNVAIISRPDNKSPKVLAYSLQSLLKNIGVKCELFFDTGFLFRLNPLLSSGKQYNPRFHYKIRQFISNYKSDQEIIKKLKEFDAIILSECIPNAYWKNYYGIIKLKQKIKKPIGLYEVFFLESSPRFLNEIKNSNPNYKTIFDFELAVSKVSYTSVKLDTTKFEIGLNLKSSNIIPQPKQELVALVDFHWEGCDDIRKIQIAALKKLGIKTIELKGQYQIETIREIYSQCSLFFLQHFESFGLPIAECLSYGAKVVTPHSGWPMAYRKDPNPAEYGNGTLNECFIVYNDMEDLTNKLQFYKESFHNSNTPIQNFNHFIKDYKHFYDGNITEILRLINYLNENPSNNPIS